MPDRLACRHFRLDGDVAADVADAERAITALDATAKALVDTERWSDSSCAPSRWSRQWPAREHEGEEPAHVVSAHADTRIVAADCVDAESPSG